LYAAALALLAASFTAGLVISGWRLEGSTAALVVLGVIALWAEHQSVRINENLAMTVSVLPALFAAAVYGPIDAMAVAAFGLLTEVGRPHARWIVWTSHRTIAVGLAGIFIAGFGANASLGTFALVVVLAAAVEALVDTSFGLLTLAIRKSGSWSAVLRSLGPIMVATVPLYGPVIVLLAYMHMALGFWVLALFLAPLIGVQALYRLYKRERAVSRELKETNARLERANVSFATALVSALDARDAYTAGHSAAVAVYARDIASRVGLDEDEQQVAHLAGLLHDIGKVGLPTGLLEKPGLLTPAERLVMQQHSEIGERILRGVDDYSAVATIVRHHHERLDGTGYPDRLMGSAIPLISRIICVADAYNAMTSGRPYRAALTTGEARSRLLQAAGSQFDPLVVAAFEALLSESSANYVEGRRPDFALAAQWSRSLPALQVNAA
jgi:putative nucleotidyltransferase with HDIG domain